MVRQELAAEKGIAVSLRTVERAVAHLRQELRAEARATVRFETLPGQQLQIDFGQRRVEIDGALRLVSILRRDAWLFPPRPRPGLLGERQEHWFAGMESAFTAFGGVPAEVLLDNARALILSHDVASREVVLNPKLHAFARHWGLQVRACAPYRPRTEGKDERGVGYVKTRHRGSRLRDLRRTGGASGAVGAGIAAQRVHGTTGEAPALRFARDEAGRLKPLPHCGPFRRCASWPPGRARLRRRAGNTTKTVQVAATTVCTPTMAKSGPALPASVQSCMLISDIAGKIGSA